MLMTQQLFIDEHLYNRELGSMSNLKNISTKMFYVYDFISFSNSNNVYPSQLLLWMMLFIT